MDGTRQGTYDASAKGDTRGVDLSYNGRLGEESKARLRAVCAFFFFFFWSMLKRNYESTNWH